MIDGDNEDIPIIGDCLHEPGQWSHALGFLSAENIPLEIHPGTLFLFFILPSDVSVERHAGNCLALKRNRHERDPTTVEDTCHRSQ
jgi:hypothetical protein